MSRIEKVSNIVLTLAVVVAAGVLVHGRIIAPTGAQPAQRDREERVEGWEAIRDSVAVTVESPARLQQQQGAYIIRPGGQRVDMGHFKVEVAVFTDYECPACRDLDSLVADIQRTNYLVNKSVIHFPLAGRRYSMDAARALECADQEGQVREMHTALYEHQAYFGLRSWGFIASEAQVGDTTAFNQCMKARPDARILAGKAFGQRLGVEATPTVIVNGVLIFPPTPERLGGAIDQAFARLRNP